MNLGFVFSIPILIGELNRNRNPQIIARLAIYGPVRVLFDYIDLDQDCILNRKR